MEEGTPMAYIRIPHIKERFEQSSETPTPPIPKAIPQTATVSRPFVRTLAGKSYSLLSYSVLSWVAIATFLVILYLQDKGKIPAKLALDTINLAKGSLVMNSILLIIFYLAVNLYKPLDHMLEKECKNSHDLPSSQKFASLLKEVSLNIVPLILTSFLGYQCLLNMQNVAWAALIPAGIFLLYLSIFPIDKIYSSSEDASVKIDRSSGGDSPKLRKPNGGSVMSIVPPTLAVYAMIVGLYYYIHHKQGQSILQV